jgi:nitrate reductase gamma subunit
MTNDKNCHTIPVFFGHVVGLAIPAKWIDGLGISESTYHFGAVFFLKTHSILQSMKTDHIYIEQYDQR